MFTKLAFVTALVAAVSAADIPINVGANGSLAFDPPSVMANIGDNLIFTFQSKNHSVYQSTFLAPCTSSGFTNDFFPVAAGSAQFPQITIQVTNTTPIWFYCPQTIPGNHCQAGMVGAVNPTADKTFQQFQAAALALAPSNGTAPSSTASATGTSSPTAGTSSPAAGTSSPAGTSSSASGTGAAPASTSTKSNSAAALTAGKLLAGVAVIAALAL